MLPGITDSAGPLPTGRLCPTVTASPMPRAQKLLFQHPVLETKITQRKVAHPGPGCCRGGGCSVGRLASAWRCSGDAGELLRTLSALWLLQAMGKARRAKVGAFWVAAGPMDRLPASLHAVGCEAAVCQG